MADGDEFVYETIENCRLFTLGADQTKYYTKDRRKFAGEDSDEITLLVQFFGNCLISDDERGLELARRGYRQLADDDDEALFETIGSVLVTRLDAEELKELFVPGNLPEKHRYNLAVCAGNLAHSMGRDKSDALFESVRARFKEMLRTCPPDDAGLEEEAFVLGELRNGRAVPLLRRYVKAVMEAESSGRSAGRDYLSVISQIRALGGDINEFNSFS